MRIVVQYCLSTEGEKPQTLVWLERPALSASFYFPACHALSTSGPLHIPVSQPEMLFIQFYPPHSSGFQHILSLNSIFSALRGADCSVYHIIPIQPLVATSRSPSGLLYNLSWFFPLF